MIFPFTNIRLKAGFIPHLNQCNIRGVCHHSLRNCASTYLIPFNFRATGLLSLFYVIKSDFSSFLSIKYYFFAGDFPTLSQLVSKHYPLPIFLWTDNIWVIFTFFSLSDELLMGQGWENSFMRTDLMSVILLSTSSSLHYLIQWW